MKKINKKQLETLAQEFYKTKFWELLSDSDIFAVELEDGRIAYCCIMGGSSQILVQNQCPDFERTCSSKVSH